METLAQAGELQWRRVRKFPEYEVNKDKQFRHIRWKRIIPRFVEESPDGPWKVMLTKGTYAIPGYVDELFNDAFPEMRGVNN